MNQLAHPKQLSIDQINEASKTLASAFQDDPLFAHCFQDPETRDIKNTIHCEFMILLGMASGEVYISSNKIEGVAVWHPHKIKNQQTIKPSKDLIRRMQRVRKEDISDPHVFKMMMIVEEIANSIQNQYVNFPHWYLSLIGVKPNYQGKGYASQLIKMKLAEIDKQNLPCFLHTENEKNLKIYEHFGFQLIGKIKVPYTNFYLHGMLRSRKKKG
jgi:ribosomal protein S18 acetylase RimI-like enzyme